MTTEARQIGFVEILYPRGYRANPYGHDHAYIDVMPGKYPLFTENDEYWWEMVGVDHVQFEDVGEPGDGLFLVRGGLETDPQVPVSTKRFGPEEWDDLLTDPVFEEGNPMQRLRLHLS